MMKLQKMPSIILSALVAQFAVAQGDNQDTHWFERSLRAVLSVNEVHDRVSDQNWEETVSSLATATQVEESRVETSGFTGLVVRAENGHASFTGRMSTFAGSFRLNLSPREPLSAAQISSLMPDVECEEMMRDVLVAVKGAGWSLSIKTACDQTNGVRKYEVAYRFRDKAWASGIAVHTVEIDRHVGVVTYMEFPSGMPGTLVELGIPHPDGDLLVAGANAYLAYRPLEQAVLESAEFVYGIPAFHRFPNMMQPVHYNLAKQGELLLMYRLRFVAPGSHGLRYQHVYVDSLSVSVIAINDVDLTSQSRGAVVNTHPFRSVNQPFRDMAVSTNLVTHSQAKQEYFAMFATTSPTSEFVGDVVLLRMEDGVIHRFQYDRSVHLIRGATGDNQYYYWQASERLVKAINDQLCQKPTMIVGQG